MPLFLLFFFPSLAVSVLGIVLAAQKLSAADVLFDFADGPRPLSPVKPVVEDDFGETVGVFVDRVKDLPVVAESIILSPVFPVEVVDYVITSDKVVVSETFSGEPDEIVDDDVVDDDFDKTGDNEFDEVVEDEPEDDVDDDVEGEKPGKRVGQSDEKPGERVGQGEERPGNRFGQEPEDIEN
jgi:hypothetical protein